MIRNFFSKIII